MELKCWVLRNKHPMDKLYSNLLFMKERLSAFS